MSLARLGFWFALVGGVAAINYAAYGSSASKNDNAIYSYGSFANGVVFYAFVLGLALLIAIDRWGLLALRRPPSLTRAAQVAAGAIVAVIAWEVFVTRLPIEDPGKEQGLTPTHWEPAHAGAFAANLVLFAVIAPVVEEITFRGVGQSLLRGFGPLTAIFVVGVAFGAWHGLLVALLVLIPFGWALAYLRERTDSVYPGIAVHALFNAAAIAFAVL